MHLSEFCIPKGTNRAAHLTDLLLYSYKADIRHDLLNKNETEGYFISCPAIKSMCCRTIAVDESEVDYWKG